MRSIGSLTNRDCHAPNTMQCEVRNSQSTYIFWKYYLQIAAQLSPKRLTVILVRVTTRRHQFREVRSPAVYAEHLQ